MAEAPETEVRPPEKIAETATKKTAKKAHLDFRVLATLGILAGLYIGFGGLLATVALSGGEEAMPYGVSRLLAGLVFTLGLILVVVSGAELFTGNTLLVVAWAEDRASLGDVARAWVLAYVTNLIGSLLAVALALGAGLAMSGDGAFGAAAMKTAQAKGELPFGKAFVSGILANSLVCLGVWMAWGARSATDKILVIIPPIAAFVALNTEHSVANMSLIPLGWGVRDLSGSDFWETTGLTPAEYPDASLEGLVRNLIPVTLGNIVGGVLVGAAYWFAYLRLKKDDEA
ncbi:formate/nitrite transporter family protein [Sabulicella rubraurantiaca]|uniref:formate/nitrite transporter family protein n=1 Tax=Sabulicella rubraurantiaca TaxID=2811429 RepID=UPI001A958268|nr:formate/nitrite transporter family protein [Sabulicella rubraurantiaca]